MRLKVSAKSLIRCWQILQVLCARGNFSLDVCWKDGKLRQVDIISYAGTPCILRYRDAVLIFKTQKGKSYRVTYQNGCLILNKR